MKPVIHSPDLFYSQTGPLSTYSAFLALLHYPHRHVELHKYYKWRMHILWNHAGWDWVEVAYEDYLLLRQWKIISPCWPHTGTINYNIWMLHFKNKLSHCLMEKGIQYLFCYCQSWTWWTFYGAFDVLWCGGRNHPSLKSGDTGLWRSSLYVSKVLFDLGLFSCSSFRWYYSNIWQDSCQRIMANSTGKDGVWRSRHTRCWQPGALKQDNTIFCTWQSLA